MPKLLVYKPEDLPDKWKYQVLSFQRIVWTEGFVGENQYRDWITEQPSFETQNVINAFDISPSQLSGVYSWQLNLTLNDGTVETKQYVVEVDGSELDLASSNTSFVQF